MNHEIYADHAATAPIEPLALEAMYTAYQEYANPAALYRSALHTKQTVEKARLTVAENLGCTPDHIFFTSGGSESNTWAIRGTVPQGGHVVTTPIEHHSVLNACASIRDDGGRMTTLEVDGFGRVIPESLTRALAAHPNLVSLQYANNEVGVVQNIPALAALCREADVLLHVDAVQAAGHLAIPLDGIELVNCTEVIDMCDEPARAIRTKKDSSIVVGLNLLKEGKGDAFVSAGSTGALHVGASLIVRTLKGVKRPALATMVPAKNKAYLLLDCGANVECRPEMLAAFAVMGSCYVNKVEGRTAPTVALANNGAEESKGTPMLREAHQLLKATPGIRFVGNIEPRDVPNGDVDVVVCDGFTGNVILKLTEGVAKMLLGMLKQMFLANLGGKLAYLLLKGGVSDLKHQMDSEEYGGAPFLGAKQPVIKAHGSSKAKGIKNAIRQAKICVENDLCGTMQSALDELAATQKTEE